MVQKNLTVDQARAVYEVLVTEAGAQGGEAARSFELHLSSDRPSQEWRFCGSLGFGGKFRFPGLRVDCYREDETDERLETIKRTNARLDDLAAQWGWSAQDRL